MIEMGNERPKNSEHFAKLLGFYAEIVTLCNDLNIIPLLVGSLAVFGYTRNIDMDVNDIDLACAEAAFPSISHALNAKGITFELKAWHVLQAHKNGSKVKFDSIEYWMADLPKEHDTLLVGGCAFNIVGLVCLKELYRRGLEETAKQHDPVNRAKHAAIAEKYAMLCLVEGQHA